MKKFFFPKPMGGVNLRNLHLAKPLAL